MQFLSTITGGNKEEYEQIKQMLLNSKLNPQAFKFDDQNCEIHSSYSMLECTLFFSYHDQVNIPSDIVELVHTKGPVKDLWGASVSTPYFVTIHRERQKILAEEKSYKERMNELTTARAKIDLPTNTKIDKKIDASKILSTGLSTFDGIIFGDDCHKHSGANNFLCDQMHNFRQQGVTHFFLEHIPDSLQNAIDEYRVSNNMPIELEVYIKYLETQYPKIKEIIDSAHQNGIRVIASETPESYLEQTGMEAGENDSRVPIGTLAMFDKIQKYNGDGKYVAFIGSAHLNYTGTAQLNDMGNKGLEQLLGVPGIRLANVKHKNDEPNLDISRDPIQLYINPNKSTNDFYFMHDVDLRNGVVSLASTIQNPAAFNPHTYNSQIVHQPVIARPSESLPSFALLTVEAPFEEEQSNINQSPLSRQAVEPPPKQKVVPSPLQLELPGNPRSNLLFASRQEPKKIRIMDGQGSRSSNKNTPKK